MAGFFHKRRNSPLAGALRFAFAKTDDPYAGADLDRAKRLGSVQWIFAGVAALVMLPLAPPTRAIGQPGWAVAVALVFVGFGAAWRMRRAPDRVGTDALLVMSYGSLAAIAALEWLAGGRGTPYHQLYLLGVIYTATVHPARRVVVCLAAFVGAVFASVLYATVSASQVGDMALQALLCVVLALISCVMMTGIRAQRVALRAEGEVERERALTDALTGIGNRRRLIADLGGAREAATAERPLVLALFDLDGFKAYNDSFGHPAGDALLQRLAAALRDVVGESGTAYRMGGDEFCVLATGAPEALHELPARWRAALSEHGEGFSITASSGSVVLPVETTDSEEALRLADRRMYAAKSLGRTSAGRQSTDVLLRALAERNHGFGARLDEVARLSEAVGAELELAPEELAALSHAAALHDVGKLAIPDSILTKPGPLSDEEWEFVRGHTLVGERILSAAPSLTSAARLVRSSHERFDGTGYPDRLAGEAIPLGSRVIAVCDAFDAMTSKRPYRAAVSADEAVRELHACAGTQFDPRVVEAFAAVLRAPRAVSRAA